MPRMRIATWNVNNAARVRAAAQARWLATQDVDVVCLQETNASSLEAFAEISEMEWVTSAADNSRQRAAAIAGRLPRTARPPVRLEGAPRPDGTLEVEVEISGQPVRVWSYHAPNGSQNQHAKVDQAHLFARALAEYQGPVVFGADLN
jgi:exonuclease III